MQIVGFGVMTENHHCPNCDILRRELIRLHRDISESTDKAVRILKTQEQITSSVLKIREAVHSLKMQRDMLYLFISNCVESEYMTSDVRKLVESLTKAERE